MLFRFISITWHGLIWVCMKVLKSSGLKNENLNMSVVWLNSLCLIGVPLCHACPLQLTVILLQLLSCSDVSIYIYPCVSEANGASVSSIWLKIHVPECINPTSSQHSCMWACSFMWGSTEGKSIIGSLKSNNSLKVQTHTVPADISLASKNNFHF